MSSRYGCHWENNETPQNVQLNTERSKKKKLKEFSRVPPGLLPKKKTNQINRRRSAQKQGGNGAVDFGRQKKKEKEPTHNRSEWLTTERTRWRTKRFLVLCRVFSLFFSFFFGAGTDGEQVRRETQKKNQNKKRQRPAHFCFLLRGTVFRCRSTKKIKINARSPVFLFFLPSFTEFSNDSVRSGWVSPNWSLTGF